MKIKIAIVTYKRQRVLNNTLKQIYNSEFGLLKKENREIIIINNHSEKITIDPSLHNVRDEIKIYNNDCRPDWSNPNLARSWNQCILFGFKSLVNPDCEILVQMQNDVILEKKWFSNLLKMHKKYDFITGWIGDNIISYKPEAIRKIGLWDEKFCSLAHKEADYYIRAMILNREKSLIGDKSHGRLLNSEDHLPLEVLDDHDEEWEQILKDTHHIRAWRWATQYFYWKWKGTWKEDPKFDGWIINWTDEFVKSPPVLPKPNFIQYLYFEEDLYNLKENGYIGFRDEDLEMKKDNRNVIPTEEK